MSKKDRLILVTAPVATRSGYGSHSRDIVYSLVNLGYDVKTYPVRWGNTPPNALSAGNERDDVIISTLMQDTSLPKQPDLHIHITIPTEFNKVGIKNIGITAGVEWTNPNPDWLDACNTMDRVIVPSNFVRDVFTQTIYEKQDKQTGQNVGKVQVNVPVDVLFEGYDEDIYKPTEDFSKELVDKLSVIKEDFCFLYVGHWLQGNLGQDRKDTGMLVKVFLETFKNMDNPPALIMKTSSAGFSIIDRDDIFRKIEEIRQGVQGNTPPIYLLHGELYDEEMNELYNYPKVKAMASLTKGEGFGRPLLEFTRSQKPIMATAWSGHVDFLDRESSFLLPGSLSNIDKSALPKEYYTEQSQWFTSDYNTASQVMADMFNNYSKWETMGYKQSLHSQDFTLKKMEEKLGEIVEETLSGVTQQVQVSLPKLKKVEKKPEIKLPKLKKV